jgi:hypothetical protein
MSKKKYLKNNAVKSLSLAISIFSICFSVSAMAESFSPEQICKAAIGQVMGKKPNIIKVQKGESGIFNLSYIREADGTKWSYRCKLEGNRVIWASDTGRWRNDPSDDVVTFSLTSNSIEITEKYSGGSSTKETYTAAQVGK